MTVATGAAGATTTRDAAAVLPSLAAVIVVEPIALAVINPVDATLATDDALDDQETVRPERTFPEASFSVMPNAPCCPSTNCPAVGESVIDDTAARAATTVMDAVPDFPSAVAVMIAVPGETAVTTPELDTPATALLLDDHVTLRSASTAPSASLLTAVACAVCATVRDPVERVTTTEATGIGRMPIAMLPDLPSVVADIVTEPTAIPLTRPSLPTVAIASELEVHVNTFDIVLPLASLACAVSWSVFPVITLLDEPLTVTLDTVGVGVGVGVGPGPVTASPPPPPPHERKTSASSEYQIGRKGRTGFPWEDEKT